MDASHLVSAPAAHDGASEGANYCSSSNDLSMDASGAAVAALESRGPSRPPLLSSSRATTPYARAAAHSSAAPGGGAKRSAAAAAASATSTAALASTLPATTSSAPPPQQRIRSRKLSRKQHQRWLKKEAADSRIYNLTLDVNDLRQQLQHLLVQKSLYATRLLVARQNLGGGALRTVDLFFRLFRRGLRAWNADERSFVYSCTDEELAIGTAAFGRQVLLDQWGSYTTLFQIRSFVNSSVQLLSSDPNCLIVRCVGEFEGRLSREAVKTVFPHIMHDEALVARVVASTFVCPANTLLHFDASGTIVRYDAQADMFEALNMLLALSPRDVITMMASARINDSSMIVDEEPTSSSSSSNRAVSSPSRVDKAQQHDATSAADADYAASRETGHGDRHSVQFILS